jgi:hypothetical protein
MWTKFTYLCTDCDALIEITASVEPQIDPACICHASSHVILLSKWDATVTHVDEDLTPDTTDMLDEFKKQIGIAIDSLDVTKVTPRGLVKINTNPYN